MYTSHGHYISGTSVEGPPVQVARCGGPNLCQRCREEAFAVQSSGTEAYQRKTIKADAVRFDGTRSNAIRIMDWVKTVGNSELDWNPIRKQINIYSPENSATVEAGDWVLLEKGSFYTKTDEEFADEYEKVQIG